MNLELIMATMENFHHCTHLPIRLFTSLNTTPEIYHYGCTSMDLGILRKYKIKQLIPTLVDLLSNQNFVHYALDANLYITICPVSLETLDSDIFIIGPYITEPNKQTSLVFKPLHCINHLLSLLDIIKDHQHIQPTLVNTDDFEYHMLHQAATDNYSYHINKAKAYIETNYQRPITLQEISDYLGIHKSYFSTIFKKSTKQSFCNYTNAIRIEKSKVLLVTTNESIVDIALATGFSSSSYFNNIFKKSVGYTPLEYRQIYQ